MDRTLNNIILKFMFKNCAVNFDVMDGRIMITLIRENKEGTISMYPSEFETELSKIENELDTMYARLTTVDLD